ncbi:MAG: CAP domain-containing protein [Proteobacteria bacterium]|nr:CAP domain-containing protein [Pseudomonadota bacterium]
MAAGMLRVGMGDVIARRATRTIAATLAVAVGLAMLGVPAAEASRNEAVQPSSNAYAGRIFSLINAERARHGLPHLRRGSCAVGYAERWSVQLARSQKLQHQSLKPMLKSCAAHRVAENIGYGNVTADALMKKWMASTHHRANILNPKLNAIGVGATRSKSGHWYAVQDFLGF